MTIIRKNATTLFTAAILLLIAVLLVRIAVLSMSSESIVTLRTEPLATPAKSAIASTDRSDRYYEVYASVDERHPDSFTLRGGTNIPSDRNASEVESIVVAEAAPVVAIPETRSRAATDPAPTVIPASGLAVPDGADTSSDRRADEGSTTGAAKAPAKVAAPEPPTLAETGPAAPVKPRSSPVEPVLPATGQIPSMAEGRWISSSRRGKSREIRIAQDESTPVFADPRPTARWQRLDAEGHAVSAQQGWSCVRDNRRNLVWEVKTRDGGLRDAAHLYSWYDPSLGGRGGARDGGRCSGGIDCDTRAYLAEVNRRALCGFSDWRLPSKLELQTLVAFSDSGGASIDLEYFPATAASWYWSASADDSRPGYAWYVLFRNGIPLNDLKTRPKHVRLVRGNRLQLASKR